MVSGYGKWGLQLRTADLYADMSGVDAWCAMCSIRILRMSIVEQFSMNWPTPSFPPAASNGPLAASRRQRSLQSPKL